eukprot:GHVN01105900.1.p2 GENE.GHVN01105900.1~~GHVN01105900.1.p2  ORF type:complete len:123 (+),score=33.16 GHVN01105900.1:91-459(+)
MAAVPSSQLASADRDSLLCTYAALLLHDDGAEVSAANITKVIKAANADVAPYLPGLFARALAGKDIGALLSMTGTAETAPGGGGAAPAGGGGAAAAAAPAKEEKKEEKEEESDEEMGFSLFD